MLFRPTPVHGARLIEPEPRGDYRGFFVRLFCEQEFAAAGLPARFPQLSTSFSRKRGTLRGLHYQLAPSAEDKVVRCLAGALHDVIVDLRPDSPSYGRSFAAELTAANRLMMYVPRGCAHGFITLRDDTEALYLVSAFYAPEQERGLRWNDPWLALRWPIEPAAMSAKDGAYPDFDPQGYHAVERLRGLLWP